MRKIVLLFVAVFTAIVSYSQISVTATAGTTGPTAYTTLSAAFDAINAGTHQGAISISVTGNTTEPASPAALLKSGGTSSYTSINIIPSGGDWTISSAASPTASRGVIELRGADNVTIDGDPLNTGARHLSIVVATNTATGTAAVRFSSNATDGTDGADNITIKNCIITGGRSSATSTTVNYGINMSNYSATSMTTGAYSSINTLIQNNLITRCYYGIYANGASATYPNTGLQILSNVIGTGSSAANNVGLNGIYLAYTSATGTGAAIISRNDIRVGEISPSGTGFGANIAGIQINAANTGVLIDRNNIHDVMQPSTSGWGAYGISFTSGTSNTSATIQNNFIRDIIGSKYSATVNGTFENYGIFINAAGVTGIKINHNTIALLTPNATGTQVAYWSACVLFGSTSTSTTAISQMLNNIFVNNNVSINAYGVATYSTNTGQISSADVNNNDYYVAGGNVGYYNGTARSTLTAWQTATGKDGSSFNINPAFVSATDVHIVTGGQNQLESAGSPVAVTGVAIDFDGHARPGPVGSVNGGATAPDIGADEFDGMPADLTPPSISYTALPVKTICIDGKTITATITDPSAVNTAAGTKPRLWFKKASELDVLPAGNTSAANGWKYVEASNSSSPFTFNFDFSLLTSPLAAGDSISYFIVAQDLATVPNVSVNAATFSSAPVSVALGAGAFPVSGAIKGFNILVQPVPVTIKVSKTDICASQTVTLDIDGVDITGGEFQWQSSQAGANTWADISGATTIPYTTGALTASTDFRLVVKCGGTPIASSPSPVVSVTVNNPQITSSTGASRCGPGTLTLTATTPPGYDINWYEAATGGTAINNGGAFTTPVLTTTTTYYVGASSGGGGLVSAGLANAVSTSGYTLEAGLFFDAVTNFTLEGVYVYPTGTGAGTATIALQNSSAVTLQSVVVNLTGTGTPHVKTYVPLNFTVPAGSNYRLVMLTRTGSVSGLIRETTWGTYPLTVPGVLSITAGKCCPDATSTSYYYFYDWQISTGCEGTRVPVTATIVSPPAITKNATPAAICTGQSSNLTVSSPNTGYTYTWTPGGLTGASVNVSPAATTKYYLTAIDNSGGIYNGCSNLDSITITVNPIPSPVSISPSPAAACAAGPAVALTADGGTIDRSYIFGTQAAQNVASTTATGFPAPYTVYYGGQRMQILVLASELATAGFNAGSSITSINFPVVSMGSDWGGATTSCNNFQVKIGTTTASSISAFASGLTPVVGPANFTPTIGYNNVHTFSAPFIWDGTSNLIIETTFSNNITGGTADLVTQYNSPTSYQSCIVYRADGVTAAAAASATTVNFSYNARPDFTLSGGSATTVTWSPVTGLYTDAGALTPYVAGTNAKTIYAKPASPATYTATATGAANCSSSATVNVSVTTPPSATIAYAGTPYCNTGTATVSHTGSTGGVYSSTTGLSINASTGAINLAASTPGTYTVTYTVAASGGCLIYTTTTSVTINAAPSATISYPGSPYCIGASTATVTHTGTPGGTYSSTAGLSIDAVTGAIDITASTLGTYTVTYTVAASGGCPVYTTTTSITIATSPAATISYAGAPYCANAGNATVTHSGSSGGIYSSTTGLSIDPATGTINLGASTPGTYTVTYSIAAGSGCSAFSTTASITINAAPSATISYTASPYCSGAGTATVTHTGTTGGTYSSTSGLSINATTGTIDLVASSPGTYTVTYTVAPANGCVVYSTTTSVTISPRPAATISYPGSPYCNTGTTVNVTHTGTTGGTYSSTAGLSIDAATGTINIAASSLGTYTVTYTVPAGNGCAVYSTTTTVSIVAPAAATINYAGSPYCTNGGTATVTHAGTTGGTYSSTNGLSINPTTGAINLGASIAGTYTVTYTVSGATGCPGFTTSASVTITMAPSATISYTGSPFCSNGTTANVTRVGTAGGTYSSTTGLSINSTTGAINIATSTPGTYTVSYTVTGSNGCADLIATTQVIITQAPSATISYAASPYCGGAGTATVTHTGTTGGTYSSTNGLVINATTGAVNLATSVAGTYVVTYTVSAANGCAVYTATTGITISAMSSATINYAGSPYCGNGSTANVTLTGTAGGTYSSTTGLSINSTTGAINIAASTPGTYTVTYAIAAIGACPPFSTTTSVTITTAPAATISYAASPYCSNAGTASVTHTGSTGGTYSSTTGLSINATTGAINLATSTAGTYTVTYTIAAGGGCAVYSTTTNITVTAAPSATISYAGSPYCGSAGTAVVTQTGTAGGTYSSSAGLSINAATGAVNIAASTPGTYTVNYTVAAASGCAAYTASTTLLLTTPGTWTGLVSADWNNAGNWCGGIPSAATDAVIPSTAPNMPTLSNGSGAVRNISTATGASLTIGTAGTLELYGNITGAGTLNAANGSLIIRGSTDQSIPAFTATNLTMNMSGAGSLILGGNSGVTGNLTLSNGNIALGSNNLSLSNSSNGKLTSHIITNGSGNVIVTNLTASQNRTVPVGSDAVSYNPVALIANAGHTMDNLTVRVVPGVYENGVSGATYPTHVVDRMWIINEGTPGGSNVNVTLQWNGSQELTGFNRAKSYIIQHNGADWITIPQSAALGGDPYSQIKTGVTSLGSFAVRTQPIPRPITGIYPNPASDHLNVVTDLLSTGPVVFSIYDSKGQLVYRKHESLTVGLNQTRLDIAQLAAGVYVVRVTTRLNEHFLVQRFVKVH